jgi:hypothetical protein
MSLDLENLRARVGKAVEDRGADRVAQEMGWKEPTVRAFVSRRVDRPRGDRWRALVRWASSAEATVPRVAETPVVGYGDPMSIPALQWREAALGVQQRLQSIRRELEQVERLAALLVRSLPVEATISHPTVPPHLAGNPLVQAALSDAPVPPQAARRRRPA